MRGVAKPGRGETPAAFCALRMAFLIRNASRKNNVNRPLALPGGYSEQAVYVAKGEVEHAGLTYPAGNLLVFDGDMGATLTARTPATLMMLGGEPLGERHLFWNFVSSRRERIEQAKADWREGRFALPPDDRDDVIPLPE